MLITLAEARAQLALEDDETEDDDHILSLIDGVAATLDSQLGVIIDKIELSWAFDRFDEFLIVPAMPVDPDSVAVTYLDSSGQSIAIVGVRAVSTGKFTRILPAIGSVWPTPADEPGVVTITASVGYIDADAVDGSADVPADLKTAGKLLVAHWFENREAAGQRIEAMPLGVQMLLDPYSRRRA